MFFFNGFIKYLIVVFIVLLLNVSNSLGTKTPEYLEVPYSIEPVD